MTHRRSFLTAISAAVVGLFGVSPAQPHKVACRNILRGNGRPTRFVKVPQIIRRPLVEYGQTRMLRWDGLPIIEHGGRVLTDDPVLGRHAAELAIGPVSEDYARKWNLCEQTPYGYEFCAVDEPTGDCAMSPPPDLRFPHRCSGLSAQPSSEIGNPHNYPLLSVEELADEAVTIYPDERFPSSMDVRRHGLCKIIGVESHPDTPGDWLLGLVHAHISRTCPSHDGYRAWLVSCHFSSASRKYVKYDVTYMKEQQPHV